jgi:hypothetical protein
VCAVSFSELIRRYPGGVLPKEFVKDFLWDADASEYGEAALRPFLTDDKQVHYFVASVCVCVCVCFDFAICVLCVCVCVCVKDFLWDADASEYGEAALRPFLTDDKQVHEWRI